MGLRGLSHHPNCMSDGRCREVANGGAENYGMCLS